MPTNTLTTLGEDEPRNILQGWAEQSAFIRFEPASDWIEVMANRKGQTVSLCLFHHGQIGFPSGTGPKAPPWQGTITVDLKQLDMPASVKVREVQDGCRLIDHAGKTVDGKLIIEAKIDYFQELVIGPSEQLEKGW